LRLLLGAAATFVLLAFRASVTQAVVSSSGREQSGRGSGCSAASTEALVRTFVVHDNRGDVAAIDRMWATDIR
jgi:hypothetical protein